MDCAQLGPVGSIRIFYAVRAGEGDGLRIVAQVVGDGPDAAVHVLRQTTIAVVRVFLGESYAVDEVRGTVVGQVPCAVGHHPALVACIGDGKAVYQAVVAKIVHSIALYADDVAVLVIGYALGVSINRSDGYTKAINHRYQAERCYAARKRTRCYHRIIDHGSNRTD